MDTDGDKVSILGRAVGLALAVLSVAALTACAVPLNKEDLAVYKRTSSF